MDRDRDGRGEGAHAPRRDPVDDAYHHEIDDPPTWDDDTYAVTGPVEAHGRSLDLGLLLLRLAGLPLVLHGIAKAVDMPAFTQEVSDHLVGGQAPDFFAWLVMLSQVALPLLVAIGLFTRPAAFLLAGLMSAIWALVVYLDRDYTLVGTQGEITGQTALLYVGLALPLVFTGAGRWSVDGLRTGGRP